MDVPLLQQSTVQFHSATVLTEAVAYLSAINGIIVKTGMIFLQINEKSIVRNIVFSWSDPSRFSCTLYSCFKLSLYLMEMFRQDILFLFLFLYLFVFQCFYVLLFLCHLSVFSYFLFILFIVFSSFFFTFFSSYGSECGNIIHTRDRSTG